MERVEIILADQDQSYREDAQRILRLYNEGYILHGTTSATETVEKISSNDFHLLLLDSHLSNGDHLSVLDQVLDVHPEMPVVIMVDEGRDDVAVAALKRGAYDYVMKSKGYLTTLPFTVRKALGHRALKAKAAPTEERAEPEPSKEPLFAEEERVEEVHAPRETPQVGEPEPISRERPLFVPTADEEPIEERAEAELVSEEPSESEVTAPPVTPPRPVAEERPVAPEPAPPEEKPSFAPPGDEIFEKAETELPSMAAAPPPKAEGVREEKVHEPSGTGMCILDQKLRFLSANKALELLTEYSEEELLELALPDLVLPAREDDFYNWLESVSKQEGGTFQCELRGKKGTRVDVELSGSAFREGNGQLAGYRVRLREIVPPKAPMETVEERIDQCQMVEDLAGLVASSYDKPLSSLLDRLAQLVCQVFRFKRSTVALLDRRRQVFVKQAVVGYRSVSRDEPRSLEVPAEVIDRLFAKKYKVKVLYYNKELRDTRNSVDPLMSERRTQERRQRHDWHRRDLILINLLDLEHHTFGYVSLDDPLEGYAPTRDTFSNLEIFGRLASLVIENFWRFSSLERRTRRLKQILVTSNIFKLYHSLSELLKEVVWSVRFSLDFNLVALALISKRTGLLEMKAVACEDKIRTLQLRELTFELDQVSELLKERYRRSKSYFIDREEPAIAPLKSIYHHNNSNGDEEGTWPQWGLILVPLKSRSGKIIGFLIADDPIDCRVPTLETIRTLEILANQVAVAVDNRVMYVQLKNQLLEATGTAPQQLGDDGDVDGGGLRKLMDRLFH